jgi:hypothetical protein
VDLIGLAGDRLIPGGRLVLSCGVPPGRAAPAPDGAGPLGEDALHGDGDGDGDSAGDGDGDGAGPPFDPSLGSPLPADYAAFACREAGFDAVEVERWPGSGYLLVATR